MSGSGGTRWGTKVVLVVLAAACGAGAWYANGEQPGVSARAEAEATATAATYVEEDLTNALERWTPADDPAKLRHQLETVVLADSDVTAVRVFDAAGTLVFSSVANDDTTLDPSVAAAVLAGDRVDDGDATTLRTYADAGSLVGEVDQSTADIRGAATLPWMIAQFGLLGFAIVLLGSAMFAGNGVRGPKQRNAPAADIAAKQTKKELDGEDPEKRKLLARAEKAEQSRRAMEDQLNVLRSQILSGDAGSHGRIGELEGHLQDAHDRVVKAEQANADLVRRVAGFEAAAAAAAPGPGRVASLETEIATSRARVKELEDLVKTIEARAAQAETTAAAHTGQLDEAHVKARQAAARLQEAVDRAAVAERQVEELHTRLATAPLPGDSNGDLVRQLQEELATATSTAGERERALQDALARVDSAELLLSAAESRIVAAEARATQAAARGTQATPAVTAHAVPSDADPASGNGVRELEIALADARAQAWVSGYEDERPSLGVVETHAVPEDGNGRPEAQELDETQAIRAELERMGVIVEHAGEAGDIDGLRERLTKSAARKKGRAVGDERIARSS